MLKQIAIFMNHGARSAFRSLESFSINDGNGDYNAIN